MYLRYFAWQFIGRGDKENFPWYINDLNGNLIGNEKLDNQKFLLLTSGGVDSLVLLNLLIQLKESHNISLIIFHVNYMLHEDSNLMEQICLSNAKSNNLKILISKCDKNLFKNKNIPMIDVDSELLNINRKLSNCSSDEFIPKFDEKGNINNSIEQVDFQFQSFLANVSSILLGQLSAMSCL